MPAGPTRTRALAALAIAGTLALTACGSSDEESADTGAGGAAVVSDGTTWTVGEVQTATRQVNSFLAANQQPEMTPQQVTHYLAYAPDYETFGTDVLEQDETISGQGFEVPSDALIERALGEDEVPSEESVQVVRSYIVAQVTQQAQLPETSELSEAMAARDVSFSPRYADQDPDWLEVTEADPAQEGLTEVPTQ